jgi:hypothetical protein
VSRRSHPSECESCGPTSQPRRCGHLPFGVRTRPHWPSHRLCRRRRRARREPALGRARGRHPRRSGDARVVSALVGAETLLPLSGVGAEGAPTQRQAHSPAAQRRDVHASACGPDHQGRRRHRWHPVARASPGRLLRPTRRGDAFHAPSRRPRLGAAGRHTPARRAHARTQAGVRRTRRSVVRARPSGRRNGCKAVARCGATPPCSRRRPALPGENRQDSAEGGASRARHHAMAARVTCLCQLGEYSARSGRPRKRRI